MHKNRYNSRKRWKFRDDLSLHKFLNKQIERGYFNVDKLSFNHHNREIGKMVDISLNKWDYDSE